MMEKMTVVVNDYECNVKLYISYERSDIQKLKQLWDQPDSKLIDLQCLEPFKGYEKWSELSPEHYRFLICRGLNIMAQMEPNSRANTKDENVYMTNFLILAFIKRLEDLTRAEIEQFRINRFNSLNVTYDFSATYELAYDKPKAKSVSPSEGRSAGFSIVVDNIDDEPSTD